MHKIPTLPALALLAQFLALAAPCQADATSLAQAVAAHDRAVHVHDHWIRDPYIVLAPDGWYYLTGTTLKQETDAVVGIPAWRSLDLATWEKIPRLWALTDSRWMQDVRPAPTPGAVQGSDFKALGVGVPDTLVWAPECHPIDERWVIVHTTNARQANLLLTAGPELTGPLTEPMGPAVGHRHDPSLFITNDGTPWVVWGVLSLQPLNRDLSGYAGPQIDLAPADRKMGHEGSVIRKIGSKYVWFGTAWSTDTLRKGTYNLYYTTADKLTGPYGPRRFAGRFLGHGTPFQDKQRRWWCTAFYNANKPPIEDDKAHAELADNAYTLNRQGTTIVPLEVTMAPDGDVTVRAKDPRYAVPGPEEVQKF